MNIFAFFDFHYTSFTSTCIFIKNRPNVLFKYLETDYKHPFSVVHGLSFLRLLYVLNQTNQCILVEKYLDIYHYLYQNYQISKRIYRDNIGCWQLYQCSFNIKLLFKSILFSKLFSVKNYQFDHAENNLKIIEYKSLMNKLKKALEPVGVTTDS